jgi:transposase
VEFNKLGHTTKAGDSCLRRILVQGARSILLGAKGKDDAVSRWAVQLQERRTHWRAVIALAAKNARMCWAMLQRGQAFKVPA